jgi:hypothetical protein
VSEECITHQFTTRHCKGSATIQTGEQGIHELSRVSWDCKLLTILMHVAFVVAAKLGPQVSDHLITCDFCKYLGLILECGEPVRVGGFAQ